MGVELLTVHLDGHDDLFERGVAGTLAQAVDGALNLRGTVAHGGQGKGSGHAQVVVGMAGHGDVLDAADVLHEAMDARAKMLRQRIAGGVGDVDDRGAGLHDGLNDALEELLLGAAGILAIELDVVDVLLGIAHRMHRTLDGLVLGDAQLVVQVRGAHAQAGVDAGTAGALEGLGSRVDVLLNGAGEAAHYGVVAGKLADLLNGDEVARAGNGETSLDDVDLQAQQLLCDEQLLLGVHGGAGRLLAVAQGGVKNCNLAGHDFLQIRPYANCARSMQ